MHTRKPYRMKDSSRTAIYRSRLARTIVANRKRLGMSQAELAYLCGVSQALVSCWERNQTPVSFEHLPALCRVFGDESIAGLL